MSSACRSARVSSFEIFMKQFFLAVTVLFRRHRPERPEPVGGLEIAGRYLSVQLAECAFVQLSPVQAVHMGDGSGRPAAKSQPSVACPRSFNCSKNMA